MSADNGIYILQCKDQYTVGHFKGFEYIYEGQQMGNQYPKRLWRCTAIKNILAMQKQR